MRNLCAHRRKIYDRSMQVFIDKVCGKRKPYDIEGTLNHVQYRAKKLLSTHKGY
jgi:hypothetical protein